MVTFERPPLNEVVLGQTFFPRPDFLIPHIGEFSARLRDRYTKAQHAQIVLGEGETPVQDSNGNWIPRVWLISSDDTWLVQIQQDRLYVNWRQAGATSSYVRFPAIKAEFDRVWAILNDVVLTTTGAALQPQRLELSYTNIIPSGDAWKTVPDLRNVLKDFQWKDGARSLPAPSRYSSQLEFQLPQHETSMVVRSDIGKRTSDGLGILRVELRVTGSAQGTSLDEWVEAAHQHIVHGFKDLTTTEMHEKHWGLL